MNAFEYCEKNGFTYSWTAFANLNDDFVMAVAQKSSIKPTYIRAEMTVTKISGTTGLPDGIISNRESQIG
jgi:hypothetical protein